VGPVTIGHALERLGHDLLGVAEPVDGGGVYPVYAVLYRVVDRGDGVLVVLGAPAAEPAGAADRQLPNPIRVMSSSVLPNLRVSKITS
jgi:hypothetical protein